MKVQNISVKENQINGIVSSGFEIKETESPIYGEITYIGEDKNRNIRTRVEGSKEAGLRQKEEDRKLSDFKEKAEGKFKTYLKNKESLTETVFKALEEEGLHVESTDSDLVEKNVEQILKNREKKREYLEKQVEDISEDRKEIERMAVSLPEGQVKEVVKRLEKSGLPLTKENVMKFSSAVEMADRVVEKIDDKAIYHTIFSKKNETIENLHKSELLPENLKREPFYEELWSEMEEKALEILAEQGVEGGEEIKGAAKWLFSHKLDINSENVAHYLSLTDLKENGKNEENREVMKEKIATTMAEGKEALSTEIGREKWYQAKFSLHYFETVVERKTIFHEVTARRQIEEIRLKLTEESAVRMLEKGIKLDITNLKGLVEELRKEEESYFKSLIEGENPIAAEPLVSEKQKENSVELFKTTLSIRSYHFKMEADSVYRYEGVSSVYQREERASLRAYHEAGLAYENGATEIRRDLGDSLKKAFSNMDEVLRMNTIEETDENRRAVKLLAYNKAEINEENILKMKKASLLTEEVFSELKPATVARLIKSGENPLDMKMEELLERLKEINRELKPESERYASYLYKLENSGEIGEEERKAYIGIYRLISKVEKGDMQAVGATELAGRELTLRNFLQMLRTKKHGIFDERVSGEIIELSGTLSENRIDRQIETAYAKLLAGKIKKEVETSHEDFLKERVEEFKGKNIELTDIERLIESGESLSISTVVAQMEVRGGRKSLKTLIRSLNEKEKEEIKELSEDTLLHFDEEEKAFRQTKEVNEGLLRRAEERIEEGSRYKDVRAFIGMKQLLSLSVKRAEIETYDIPLIYDEDKYADFQITIRKAQTKEDAGKLEMKLALEEREINLSFRLNGNRLSGLVLSEHREEVDKLKSKQEALLDIIEELGFVKGEIFYHQGKASSLFMNYDDIYSGKTETKKLYQLAKRVSTYLLKEIGLR